MAVEPDPQRYRGKTLDEVLAMAESFDGKIDPPPTANKGTNSRVLAQVLGFKFTHYQVRNSRQGCTFTIDFSIAPRRQRSGATESISHDCNPYTRRLPFLGRSTTPCGIVPSSREGCC